MSSEAIEALARRIRDTLTARVHEDGIWRAVVFGGDTGTANTFASLIAADLASPEGRAALIAVLRGLPIDDALSLREALAEVETP